MVSSELNCVVAENYVCNAGSYNYKLSSLVI